VKLDDTQDHFHLEAAEGWLGLADWKEANEELENISPANRAHPEVLCIRWQIYNAAEKWEAAAEISKIFSAAMAIYVANSLHKSKRTDAARDLLLSLVDTFPANCRIRYSLACYASQLGDFKDARDLARAGVLSLNEP